jgi:uncharacterized protein YgiM (DUF1202 family)
VAAGILLSAGPALADPQTKVVNGDSVRTRSGPGEYWYPTGKLNRGDKVVVVGKQFGWVEIKPPADQRSLILKTDVDLRSQLNPGGTGVVKGDQAVAVRACPIEEARSNRIQCYLRPGAEVAILSPWQMFYLIAPPAGATVFIKADFLAEPGTIPEIVRPGPVVSHPPTTDPDNTTATAATTKPEQVETVAGTTSTTQPAPTTIVGLDIRTRVAEDQKLIKEQLAKPMTDRDFTALVARMEELKVQNARTPIRGVREYADAMIAYANRQAKLAGMVSTMAVTRPDVDQAIRDADAAMVTKPADYFQAIGILNKSIALGSSLSMPNLHKLESMDGQKVLCYIVPEDGADWSMFEGKQVQVTGKKHYRADWKIYLVRPDKIAMADKASTTPNVTQPPPALPPMELTPEEIQKVIDAAAGGLPPASAPDVRPDGLPSPLPTPAPIPAPPTPPAGPEGGLRPAPLLEPTPVTPPPPGPPTLPATPTVPPTIPALPAPTSAPAPVGP